MKSAAYCSGWYYGKVLSIWILDGTCQFGEQTVTMTKMTIDLVFTSSPPIPAQQTTKSSDSESEFYQQFFFSWIHILVNDHSFLFIYPPYSINSYPA